MSKVQITVGQRPYQGKVIVDGRDISKVVRRIVFEADAAGPALVQLDMVPEAVELDADAKVIVTGLLRGEDGD